MGEKKEFNQKLYPPKGAYMVTATVPIPTQRRCWLGVWELKVGESTWFQGEPKDRVSLVASAAFRRPMKFVTRREGTGYRAWRVA